MSKSAPGPATQKIDRSEIPVMDDPGSAPDLGTRKKVFVSVSAKIFFCRRTSDLRNIHHLDLFFPLSHPIFRPRRILFKAGQL